jgi:hypothetical protein
MMMREFENMQDLYRTSLVRMYYVRSDKQKNTPRPFLELRVFVYHKTKMLGGVSDKLVKEMYRVLDYLEWTFDNIVKSVLDGSVWQRTDGFENESIDADEVADDMKRAGHKEVKPNELYRYAVFYKANGSLNQLGESYIRAKEQDRESYAKLTKVSDEKLEQFVKTGKAYWRMISFEQYLRIKSKLGL